MLLTILVFRSVKLCRWASCSCFEGWWCLHLQDQSERKVCLTLNIKTQSSSLTSETTHPVTQRRISEDWNDLLVCNFKDICYRSLLWVRYRVTLLLMWNVLMWFSPPLKNLLLLHIRWNFLCYNYRPQIQSFKWSKYFLIHDVQTVFHTIFWEHIHNLSLQMYSRTEEINNILFFSQARVGDIEVAWVTVINLTGLVNISVQSQLQFAGNKIVLTTFEKKILLYLISNRTTRFVFIYFATLHGMIETVY